MKSLLKPLALVAFVFTGCDAEKSSTQVASREITVGDLAWATEWNIYKWKISELTDEKLQQIQVVVIGPEGDVIQEGASIGYNSVLDSDMEIALAFKKTGADIDYKIRGQGSVTSSFKGLFTGNTWSYGPDGGIHEGLLVVATSSGSSIVHSESALASPGFKLCLKFIPANTEKPTTSSNSDSKNSPNP